MTGIYNTSMDIGSHLDDCTPSDRTTMVNVPSCDRRHRIITRYTSSHHTAVDNVSSLDRHDRIIHLDIIGSYLDGHRRRNHTRTSMGIGPYPDGHWTIPRRTLDHTPMDIGSYPDRRHRTVSYLDRHYRIVPR